MKRPRVMHLSLTTKSAERLLALAEEQGVTRSELIRRWIDAEYSRAYPRPPIDSGEAAPEDQ